MSFADRLEARAEARKRRELSRISTEGRRRLTESLPVLEAMGAPDDVLASAREALDAFDVIDAAIEAEESQ